MLLKRESVSRTGLETTRLTFRRSGAAKHGYTESQKTEINNKVYLAKSVQENMLRNYVRYIQHTLFREDELKHKKIKGSPTGEKGRQIIRPEQMGHEVQTC
eukprot:1020053-Heterocapsa_arctica.AAC.1